MTVIVKLDAWAFIKEFTKRIVSWINKALPVLLEELKRLTPEDTGEMLSSYRTYRAENKWDSVIWYIENDSGHAIFVEYWRSGVMFWYHKPKWRLFYVGEWNRTFARAVDNVRDQVVQIIYNEIGK